MEAQSRKIFTDDPVPDAKAMVKRSCFKSFSGSSGFGVPSENVGWIVRAGTASGMGLLLRFW